MSKSFSFSHGKIILEIYNFPKQDHRKNGWIYHTHHIIKRAIKLFTAHYTIEPATYIKINLDRRIKTYYASCTPLCPEIILSHLQAYEICIASDLEGNSPEFILWHELAHLVQYQSKKIQTQTDKKTKYNGKWYNNLNHLNDDYNDLPWEANAIMVSNKLWKKYRPRRSTKKNKKYYASIKEKEER